MSWSDLFGTAPATLRGSAAEGDRFGLTVDRVFCGDGCSDSDDDVRALVAGSTADLVILRYPARRVSLFAALLGNGRDVLLADQLIYWRLETGSGRRPAPRSDLVAGPLDDDTDLVHRLVGEIFTDYGNHYLADPVLDPAAALAGYQEWAVRSAAGGGTVVLRRGEEPLGVATTDATDGVLEIELAGVLEEHRSQGLYAHLLAAVEDVAAEASTSSIVISTQAHNTGVQRAWARYGFEPVVTFATAHLLRPGLLGG